MSIKELNCFGFCVLHLLYVRMQNGVAHNGMWVGFTKNEQ